MNRQIAAAVLLVIGAPLLLWGDIWLAIQFGNWINHVLPSDQGQGGGMLGMVSFFVLAAAQGISIWLGMTAKGATA